MHTLSTHIRTPSSHTPTLTWPEAKVATSSQGLDNNNDHLHSHCVHHPPMFLPRFQRAANHPLQCTRDHQHRTASGMKPITLYIFLPLFSFFFSFFLCYIPNGTGQPGSAETHMNIGASLTWFFFFCFFFLFFSLWL